MEDKLYIHVCMDCGCDWESKKKEEDGCPRCHCGDITSEEAEDDKARESI